MSPDGKVDCHMHCMHPGAGDKASVHCLLYLRRGCCPHSCCAWGSGGVKGTCDEKELANGIFVPQKSCEAYR